MIPTPWALVRSTAEALRKLRFRVDAMVTRAVIEMVNDRMKTQRVQLTILEGEVVDDCEHMQPYGLSFTPPAGAECIALAPAGYRSHTIAICAQEPDERPLNAPPRAGGLYTKSKWRLYIDAEGVVSVGSDEARERMLLGDQLVKLLEQLTVPTPMGPSGTPINAASFRSALSRHKIAP